MTIDFCRSNFAFFEEDCGKASKTHPLSSSQHGESFASSMRDSMLLGSASSYWLVVKVSKFMDTHFSLGNARYLVSWYLTGNADSHVEHCLSQ